MEITREYIEKLSPGREMDCLVAEHVMCKKVHDGNMFPGGSSAHIHRDHVPMYSLLLGQSMDVLYKSLRRVGGNIQFGDDLETRVEIYGEVATDENVPTAICRAALLAGLKKHLEVINKAK